MPSDTLPFVCPNCSKRFGFGDDPALLNIVATLPFYNEKTPCCGAVISGKVIRRDDGSVELDLIRQRERASKKELAEQVKARMGKEASGGGNWRRVLHQVLDELTGEE